MKKKKSEFAECVLKKRPCWLVAPSYGICMGFLSNNHPTDEDCAEWRAKWEERFKKAQKDFIDMLFDKGDKNGTGSEGTLRKDESSS